MKAQKFAPNNKGRRNGGRRITSYTSITAATKVGCTTCFRYIASLALQTLPKIK